MELVMIVIITMNMKLGAITIRVKVMWLLMMIKSTDDVELLMMIKSTYDMELVVRIKSTEDM